MGVLNNNMKKALINTCMGYIEKNPKDNIPKLLNTLEKLATMPHHKRAIEKFRSIYADDESNWKELINYIIDEIDPNVAKKLVMNFFVNSNLIGRPKALEYGEKHDCNVPWAILIDPTSACNLKCIGCWAAEYDKCTSLTYEKLDEIITEGKELGIYMYLYSGGEPLMRKNDLIKLAEKHNDCMFLAFTNATLIDDEFAKEVQRVGNFVFAISIEGFEKETDMRRGNGTYQKVLKGMDILKKHGLIFGFSCCYHSQNTDAIGSEEYLDFMIEKGCTFGWYFTYVPVGKDAVTDLIATPEQRKFMYHQVRHFRATKPIFVLDFWNDGEYVQGCIAGGRNYFHINSNGDVEPCAFIHYSDRNINNCTLAEALQSPLFKEYRKNQPFNQNHLRPCPMMDNPEKIVAMVKESGAASTQPMDKEEAEELVSKTIEPAKKWAPVADELWNNSKCTECAVCTKCK